MKKLYKSDTNKVCAGVVGGIGEYLEVDPTMLRVVWLLIVVFTGVFPGILAYIITIFVIPKKPQGV